MTIAINELKLFFYTPIAYIIGSSFYLINGILFWYLINKANTPGEFVDNNIMANITGGIVFWLTILLLIPVISMRMIAFEAEKNRLLHLFSAPVKTFQITLGKFFGGLSFYLLLWVPSIIYYLILSHYCNIEPGTVFIAYLGIALSGAFFLSIGLFASSLTSNQITCAISTFALLVGILIISLFDTIAANSFLKDSLQYLNFVNQFMPFSEGLFDSRGIAYFLSFTLFFLFASNEILNYRRYNND